MPDQRLAELVGALAEARSDLWKYAETAHREGGHPGDYPDAYAGCPLNPCRLVRNVIEASAHD